MVKRLENKLLIATKDVSPSREDLKVIGVFNPGIARYQDTVKMLVRVAEESIDLSSVDTAAPGVDHREIRTANGFPRLPSVSHFKLVTLSKDGHTVTNTQDIDALRPLGEYETFGIEDARITFIEDRYYITYVSVSEQMGVCTSLMSTQNFSTFERLGIIFPQENKEVVLFPEKINGRYVAYHRPRGLLEFRHPAIQIAYSTDLLHWGKYRFVIGPNKNSSSWDYLRMGPGVPPIKTDCGWLNIYHGVSKTTPRDKIGRYSAGAFLTELNNPDKVVARSSEPILCPNASFEKKGYVSEVVFPTGYVTDQSDSDTILVYYGCADAGVAVVKLSIKEILNSLN